MATCGICHRSFGNNRYKCSACGAEKTPVASHSCLNGTVAEGLPGFHNSTIKCGTCGGDGKIDVTKDNSANCPTCNHTGKVNKDTPCSHGKGYGVSHKYCDHNANGVKHD